MSAPDPGRTDNADFRQIKSGGIGLVERAGKFLADAPDADLAHFGKLLVEWTDSPRLARLDEALGLVSANAGHQAVNLEAALHAMLTAPERERHVLLGRLVSAGRTRSPMASARGGVSPSRRHTLDCRDVALRKLLRLPELQGLSMAETVKWIDSTARRYEAVRWQRERDWAGPPPSEPAATYWHILNAGARVPGKKQLKRILGVDFQ